MTKVYHFKFDGYQGRKYSFTEDELRPFSSKNQNTSEDLESDISDFCEALADAIFEDCSANEADLLEAAGLDSWIMSRVTVEYA